MNFIKPPSCDFNLEALVCHLYKPNQLLFWFITNHTVNVHDHEKLVVPKKKKEVQHRLRIPALLQNSALGFSNALAIPKTSVVCGLIS